MMLALQQMVRAKFAVDKLLGIGVICIVNALDFIYVLKLCISLLQHKRGYIKAYLIYTCIFIVFAIVEFIGSIAKGVPAKTIIQNLFSLCKYYRVYSLIIPQVRQILCNWERTVEKEIPSDVLLILRVTIPVLQK